jgi:signal transduction histidine kinase
MMLFFSCFSLFAQNIIDSPLIENIQLHIEGDKKSKFITEFPLKIELDTKYDISFSLNLSATQEPIYLLVEMVETKSNVEIDGEKINPSFVNRYPYYLINSRDVLHVKVTVQSSLQLNEINIRILKNEEFILSLLLERIWLGISLGILLAVAIYNGAFFVFNRDKSYLYYSLFQISLFTTMSLSMGVFTFDIINEMEMEKLQEALSLVALIFAILFGQSFLQTKEKTPILNVILNFFIAVYFLGFCAIAFFTNYFIIEIFPTFPAILFLLYASYVRIREKFKPAYFYFLGWSIFCLGLIVLEVVTLDYEYDYLYILSFCFSLEALILSLAISYKVKLIERDKIVAQIVQQEQQQMMLHQSRMAAMGEMVGSIAHQWRQPLTHLSYLIMNLKSAFKHGEMDETYLSKKSDEASKQILHMSQTIEDFKNFYNPSKEKDKFFVDTVCINTLQIVEASFKHHHIR